MSASLPSRNSLASLVARDVGKSFGPHVVLDGVSVTIGPRSRIGVIAPNGTGKSTLLRILAGIDTPDSGRVTRTPPTATVGYLPQEPERRAGETVRAYLARRTGVADAEQRARRREPRPRVGRPRTPTPTTRTRTRSTRTSRSAPPTSTPASAPCSPTSASPNACSTSR